MRDRQEISNVELLLYTQKIQRKIISNLLQRYFLYFLLIRKLYLQYTKKKGLVFYNTIILSVLFILIGFSSWLMLPIRANANPPINENKPSDAAEVLAYYNREQYGEQHLFFGPQFSEAYSGLDENNP